jgi:hypothetical protein
MNTLILIDPFPGFFGMPLAAGDSGAYLDLNCTSNALGTVAV